MAIRYAASFCWNAKYPDGREVYCYHTSAFIDAANMQEAVQNARMFVEWSNKNTYEQILPPTAVLTATIHISRYLLSGGMFARMDEESYHELYGTTHLDTIIEK